MKHAFLIMAHNEFEVLNVLLSLLDDERNDIYLHIDKKVKNIPSLYQMQKAGFRMVEPRQNVYWGDISQVKVELLLFSEAFNHGSYLYYHLISGVDLPIKSQDYIHSFFDNNPNKLFVGYFQGDYHENDVIRKISKYYLFMRWNKKNPQVCLIKRIMGAVLRYLFLKIQYLFHYSRRSDFCFKKGHQWVSLSQDGVAYLLSKEKAILQRFKWVNTPDEIYKQSVFWSSPYRDNIYNITDANLGSLRDIDWNRGRPYVWRNSDFEELKASNCLFARKFSSSDKELLQLICKCVCS